MDASRSSKGRGVPTLGASPRRLPSSLRASTSVAETSRLRNGTIRGSPASSQASSRSGFLNETSPVTTSRLKRLPPSLRRFVSRHRSSKAEPPKTSFRQAPPKPRTEIASTTNPSAFGAPSPAESFRGKPRPTTPDHRHPKSILRSASQKPPSEAAPERRRPTSGRHPPSGVTPARHPSRRAVSATPQRSNGSLVPGYVEYVCALAQLACARDHTDQVGFIRAVQTLCALVPEDGQLPVRPHE
jgi:hypothetical protein